MFDMRARHVLHLVHYLDVLVRRIKSIFIVCIHFFPLLVVFSLMP